MPTYEFTVTITAERRTIAEAIRDDIAQLIGDSEESGAYADAEVAAGLVR